MVSAWVVFPLVMLAVCLGCGLLVERATGRSIPGVIVPSLGLALIVVVAVVETESTALAPVTPWVVLALAIVGYGVGWRRLRAARIDPWAVALGVLVFLVYAAPILTTGHPGFGGYSIDGDPTFHLVTASDLLAHGHTPLVRLPYPSGAAASLSAPYLATSFPFGSDLAAAILAHLTASNLAWVYSPFMAGFLALGALALWELIRRLVPSPQLRLLVVFVAAQAGMAYWFFLIASIKELATSWVLSLFAAVVVDTLRHRLSARALIPVLLVAVTGLDVIQLSIVAWLVIGGVAFVAAALWQVRASLRRPQPRVVGAIAFVLIVALAAALPLLHSAIAFYHVTAGTIGKSSQSGSSGLAYLSHPLSLLQIMSVWPTGDPRLYVTADVRIVYALIWLTIASAVLGGAWALYRRAWGPVLLLFGSGVGAWILLTRSDPYAASKVIMILSISALLAAMLGAVALHDRVNRWLGWALGLVIALAVLWTNGQQLRYAQVIPQPRFSALTHIARRFSGDGLTLYTGWDFEYPAWFLRGTGPYVALLSPTQFVMRPGLPARDVGQLQLGWDPNTIELSDIESLPTLVIPRSPATSRPPANFTLVDSDRYYDVYRRESSPQVLESVPITEGGLIPDTPVSCPAIRALGRRAAREHAQLAVARSPIAATLIAARTARPPSWFGMSAPTAPQPGMVILPTQAGFAQGQIRVPATGRYTLWVEGEITQRMSFSIDFHDVGAIAHQIGPGGQYTRVGVVSLQRGVQPLIIHRFAAPDLSPRHYGDTLGDMVLTPGTSTLPPTVQTLSPGDASSLCGQSLQWIEIVRGSHS